MNPLTSFFVGRPQRWLGWLAAGGCCMTLLAPGADAKVDPKADTKAPTAPAKPALPTSFEFSKFVFVDDIKVGKDPFYPKSKRREPEKPKVAENTGTPTNPADPPKLVIKPKASSFLTLKGMLGSKAKRLVLIGTATDSYEFVGTKPEMVETPEGRVKVRCVEFKRESVVISVEGEADPVELKLTD